MSRIENNEQVTIDSGAQKNSATKSVADASDHKDKRDWLQTRPGELTWIVIPAMETNGAYSVVEIVSSPGDSTPMHVHQSEDEHFVIVEGTARIAYGDEVFDAPAGTSVTLARKIPHAWGNASDSLLRMVTTCTPGGVEEVLRLMVQGGTDIDLKASPTNTEFRRSVHCCLASNVIELATRSRTIAISLHSSCDVVHRLGGHLSTTARYFLLMPLGFPPHGRHPALRRSDFILRLARHYPRFWI